LLAESLIFALSGGTVGAALSYWSVALFGHLARASLPRLQEVHVDGQVLAFTAAAALGSALVFGLVPAWQSSRSDVNENLKEGSRGASAGRGVVRAKTGTLTGVSSLAGITTDADGRLLVFAFMSNDVIPSVVRPRLDAIAAALSRCGCR
jgi:hypothetical protein